MTLGDILITIFVFKSMQTDFKDLFILQAPNPKHDGCNMTTKKESYKRIPHYQIFLTAQKLMPTILKSTIQQESHIVCLLHIHGK